MVKSPMKIWSIVLAGILLVFGLFVLVDRHRHIRCEGEYHDKVVVYMHDSWFVDLPFESGVDLSGAGFNPAFAYVYADSLNPLFRTVKNPSLYYTNWVYYTEYGEPMMFQVFEQSKWDIGFINPYSDYYSNFDMVDGVEISYGQTDEAGFVLGLENEGRAALMVFAYSQLENVKPALEKVWSQIKDGEE